MVSFQEGNLNKLEPNIVLYNIIIKRRDVTDYKNDTQLESASSTSNKHILSFSQEFYSYLPFTILRVISQKIKNETCFPLSAESSSG